MLPGPAARTPDGRAVTTVDLDAELVRALTGVARMLGVALKSVALAAHVRALATWTGRTEDVVTGVVFNTRPAGADSDQALGLFLNTLPVRFPSVADTWAGLVTAANAVEQGGVAHREYPQAALVAKLGRAPFDVAFNFMDFHAYRGESPVATRSWWRQGKTSLGFHVSVEITGAGGQIRVGYDPDHLPRHSVEEFAGLLSTALRAVAANPVSPAR
jgi:non-ribosomal peptide synthetase component F